MKQKVVGEKKLQTEGSIMEKRSSFERKMLTRSWRRCNSRRLDERAEEPVASVAETLGLVHACLGRAFSLKSDSVTITCLAWMWKYRKFGFRRVIVRFSAAVFQKVQYQAVFSDMKTNACVIFSHQFEWNQVSDRFWTRISSAENCSK